MTDEPFFEPFGPVMVPPEPKECPNCACCSARLCERGARSTRCCSGQELRDPSLVAVVSGCPCSAETTPGTHAWRAAMVRITRHALERPLRTPAALLLRALATDESAEVVEDPENLLGMLKAYKYVAVDPGDRLVITDFGRRYLQARTESRFATPVEVVAVDQEARTAAVIVVGWHLEKHVTVLMDQLTNETGLKPGELVGVFLEAEANCHAETADEVVLTNIRRAPDLPDGWMDGSVTSAE